VILTTGFATPELELEAIEAGAVDLIDKEEFDTQRLDRAVRFAAGRQRRLDRSAGPAPPAGDDLAGPALLADRLGRALATARRRRTGVAVVVIDPGGPDGGGPGLDAGDRERLLRAAGRRLRFRVRETDTVARTAGGDLLAVVLADLGRPEDAALVPGKLLDALALPVLLDGDDGGGVIPRVAAASLGVASFPRDGADADELLRHAEGAMRRARLAGGGLCRFHDEAGLGAADGAWAGGLARRRAQVRDRARRAAAPVPAAGDALRARAGLGLPPVLAAPGARARGGRAAAQAGRGVRPAGAADRLDGRRRLPAGEAVARRRPAPACTSRSRSSPGASSPGAGWRRGSRRSCGPRACRRAGSSWNSKSGSCSRSWRPGARRSPPCANSACAWRSTASAAPRRRVPRPRSRRCATRRCTR
jgi:GGDEF domain-containing protein